MNLASISLRLGGRRLLWDSASAKITNIPEATSSSRVNIARAGNSEKGEMLMTAMSRREFMERMAIWFRRGRVPGRQCGRS